MAAMTFDTLKFTKRLTGAEASPELAEATAEAFKDFSPPRHKYVVQQSTTIY
uniref:DUF1640 domain-containing protein n=1 Tax=Candidatus Kentrum eta TaxID=2126337 RepID=A0A450UPH7_9GAMM|nr:MAG: hypothetical protein BECKH772A_GA0070896_1005914 [Candidatus Kentron sp. H]VFJ94419.1 MAG: hypothetical protein BECKH772B_GA0070898_1006114 [Candidatus Kentron sp. H]VFK01068.1 MAG: hypothetical protein BECKH772C_GA0070978_1005712 [Candidatus Kentron sp. H]